jgi:hypothetical protein
MCVGIRKKGKGGKTEKSVSKRKKEKTKKKSTQVHR